MSAKRRREQQAQQAPTGQAAFTSEKRGLILVSPCGGELGSLDTYSYPSLRQLREAVAAKTNVPAFLQRLSVSGRVLAADSDLQRWKAELDACGAPHGAVVLVERLDPGLAGALPSLAMGQTSLTELPESLRTDRGAVLTAVKGNGLELRHATAEQQADRYIVLTAVQKNGLALGFASPKLQRNRHIVMAAVRHSGLALRFAAPELRQDREIVMAAIANDPGALAFVPEPLQNERGIIQAAVSKGGLDSFFDLQLGSFGFDEKSQEDEWLFEQSQSNASSQRWDEACMEADQCDVSYKNVRDVRGHSSSGAEKAAHSQLQIDAEEEKGFKKKDKQEQLVEESEEEEDGPEEQQEDVEYVEEEEEEEEEQEHDEDEEQVDIYEEQGFEKSNDLNRAIVESQECSLDELCSHDEYELIDVATVVEAMNEHVCELDQPTHAQQESAYPTLATRDVGRRPSDHHEKPIGDAEQAAAAATNYEHRECLPVQILSSCYYDDDDVMDALDSDEQFVGPSMDNQQPEEEKKEELDVREQNVHSALSKNEFSTHCAQADSESEVFPLEDQHQEDEVQPLPWTFDVTTIIP
ncbi:unnamed protein product [Polarella glacialis]|uniref:DUF4116 domain-containing protein n=1 Tax=Polarella glacialis TaxID=89957 RepID=A0A813KD58_POLGL|nr:unnamed protein product [Polarella glacialis]